MRDWRVGCAYGLFGLALLLAGFAVGAALLTGMDWDAAVSTYLVTNTAIGVSAAPCGLLIARARPRNPIGWLFLLLAVAPLLSAAAAPLLEYGPQTDWPLGVLRLVVTVFAFSWPWGVFVALPLVLQLFPTGRPLGPRWRGLVWLTLVMAVVGSVGTGPTPDYGASSYLVSPVWEPAEVLAGYLGLAVWLLSIVSLVVRFVRGDELIRRQLLWLVLAMLFAIGINLPWTFVLHSGPEILFILAFPLIPVAVTIAILRHGLFDVRLVVSRTVLYGLLTAGVAGSYLGLVAVLDRVLRGAGAPVLASLAVALAFNPVRTRLQLLVDRALYGVRRDPVRAVSAVGRRLAADDLGGVLAGLREALRLPYAALEAGPERIVSSGEPTSSTQHATALVLQGEWIGQLVVGARWGERRLPAADRVVLDLLAGPLAIALRATVLSEQLQVSRERLITATAEERRRLHRELHDSLGPVLTGAALKADGTALAARTDGERAERLATELADQLRQAVGDVRRLVYGLRPPALDELGLVAALRRQEGQLGELTLTIDASEPLPELPAAVEVAAYRIATEAITNVVRHAHARRAVLSLSADTAALRVSVTDDGSSPDGWVPGVGLQSIRERVAEVGGRCEAGPTAAGGQVVALLPLGGTT